VARLVSWAEKPSRVFGETVKTTIKIYFKYSLVGEMESRKCRAKNNGFISHGLGLGKGE